MRLAVVLLILGLTYISMASYSVKLSPSLIIDLEFLNTIPKHNTASFSQLTSLMQQQPQQVYRDYSKITQFFQDLRTRLATERTEQLAILDQQRAQCKEEAKFRNEEIAEAQESSGRARSQFDLCTSEKAEAEHFRSLAINARKVYEQELAALIALRESRHETYLDRGAKLDTAVNNIETVIEFIDKLEAESAALVTVPASLVQVTNTLLQLTVHTGSFGLVLPVFNKLMEIHQRQFNPETISQVRALLLQLKDNTLRARTELDQVEAQEVASFNAERDNLTDLIARLQIQETKSDAYIATMTDCIAQEQNILQLAGNKITRNQGLLDSSIQMCQLNEDQYNQAELARTKQTTLINALEAAFNRLATQYEQETAPQVGKIISLKLL